MRVILIPPALPRGLKERERGIRVSDSDLGGGGGDEGRRDDRGRLRSMNIFRMTDGGNKYSVATQTLPIYPWTK